MNHAYANCAAELRRSLGKHVLPASEHVREATDWEEACAAFAALSTLCNLP